MLCNYYIVEQLYCGMTVVEWLLLWNDFVVEWIFGVEWLLWNNSCCGMAFVVNIFFIVEWLLWNDFYCGMTLVVECFLVWNDFSCGMNLLLNDFCCGIIFVVQWFLFWNYFGCGITFLVEWLLRNDCCGIAVWNDYCAMTFYGTTVSPQQDSFHNISHSTTSVIPQYS